MFAIIECDKNKAEISNIEIGEGYIVFSLSHFFHLNFRDSDEVREFLANFLKHTQRQFSVGQSYAELDESLSFKKQEGFIPESARPMAIRMYRIIENSEKNCLEIDFYLDKGNLIFFLYQDMIDDIKSRI